MVMHPVGPLPASTYWRRRLVLLGALVVLALVARSCVSGGGEPTRTGAAPTPTPTRAVPTSSPRPVAVGACRDSQLRVTVEPDAERYPPGSTARFAVAVANTSRVACRRDLGTAQLAVVVRSGADRIWSSQDCPRAEKAAEVITIKAGGRVRTTVSWPGTRSKPGCSGARSQARPGTYTVRVALGELRSEGVVFKVSGG